jgi:hypothetical protein
MGGRWRQPALTDLAISLGCQNHLQTFESCNKRRFMEPFYVWAKVASETKQVSIAVVENAYLGYLAGPTK